MNCEKCGEPVTDLSACWHQIVGWELPRGGGGTNAVKLRKRTGKVMHQSCMHVYELKDSPGDQEKLL